ncbi:MAG: hypothetical protein H7Y09_00905 [Chitinophagaceae bacterium]|nr:hypothetical protein [Anaerolineae bacterium]
MMRLFGRGSSKALMSVKDADLIETTLLNSARKLDRPLRVLEWGSGKSTIYYTDMLSQNRVAFEWVSLEYDRLYFQEYLSPRLQSAIKTPVEVLFHDAGKVTPYTTWNRSNDSTSLLQLVVFDYGSLKPSRRKEDRQITMDDYVSYPSTSEKTFDIIIVDGRKRSRCLIEAAQIAKDQTIVFCHDAHRAYYHSAFSHYPYHRLIGDWLWVGSHSKQAIDLVSSFHAQSFGISRFFTIQA